ncbi:MAG: hypothetical protein ACTSVI_07890 [Promethearchaeota archaeon]
MINEEKNTNITKRKTFIKRSNLVLYLILVICWFLFSVQIVIKEGLEWALLLGSIGFVALYSIFLIIKEKPPEQS